MSSSPPPLSLTTRGVSSATVQAMGCGEGTATDLLTLTTTAMAEDPSQPHLQSKDPRAGEWDASAIKRTPTGGVAHPDDEDEQWDSVHSRSARAAAQLVEVLTLPPPARAPEADPAQRRRMPAGRARMCHARAWYLQALACACGMKRWHVPPASRRC